MELVDHLGVELGDDRWRLALEEDHSIPADQRGTLLISRLVVVAQPACHGGYDRSRIPDSSAAHVPHTSPFRRIASSSYGIQSDVPPVELGTGRLERPEDGAVQDERELSDGLRSLCSLSRATGLAGTTRRELAL